MIIVADPADAPIKIINIGIANALSVATIKSKPNASGNKKKRNKCTVLNLSIIQPAPKVTPITLKAKKGRRMLKV